MLRDAQIIGCADMPQYADMPLLPLLSKVLERVIYNGLTTCIHICNIFYDYQFGCRKKHSASVALVQQIVENIAAATDSDDYVLGRFS